MGPMAKRIMQSARELGYAWDKLPKFLYQDKCRPDCDKCNLGCPYGAKFTARMLVEDAVRDGATLVNNAKVKRVLLDGKNAVGLEFSMGHKNYKVYAPRTVISSGGIGSPIILRSSGIKGAGFDYFFDPLICAMGTVKDITGGKEFPMAAGRRFEDEGYVMTDMTVPAGLYMGLSAEVLRFDRMFAHSHTLGIMIKEKDSLGGYLTDKEGVRKKLASQDVKSLMHGYDRAKNILRNAGAKNIFKSWYIAAHPGGTVKVGHLLDSNLKTEYDNLYVCDASVIPEAWGLPPSFTIYSLGKRLSKHLMAGEDRRF
jgi:choline dehydrogenase-like flavoprotein